MSARTAVTFAPAFLTTLVLAVGCTGQEQVLGGAPPAPNDPRAVPTTWVTERHPFKCPYVRPTEGSTCEAFDDTDAAVAPQCEYDPGTSCPSVCVCGFGGRWSCFHAACGGMLTEDGCVDGASCSDGAGCSTDRLICSCDSPGSAFGALRCVPRSNP